MPEFRLQSRKFLLTYSRYEADKYQLHMFLNSKLKQEVAVKICHEHHQDGEIHTHCCVECKIKPDIKNERAFDFEGHHPNIKPPSSVTHWRNQVKYMDKEDPLVYGEIEILKTKDEEFTEACEYVKGCKTRKAMYAIGPHLKVISSKVMFFENFWKNQAVKSHSNATYPLSTTVLQPITDWTLSHLVWGKAGAGKTQWALGHFKTPLLVSHMDKLKLFDSEIHDGIVFDDMSFRHLHAEAIIHLLDTANDREIHARYDIASIPAGTKKIFCHNKCDIFMAPCDAEQLAAIMRRYVAHEVKAPLF